MSGRRRNSYRGKLSGRKRNNIARSWILLFTLAATVWLWWAFYNQLKLDFYLSWLLGFVAAFVLNRIVSFGVGMHLRKKYARQFKAQLLGR
jgi:hypothetical protein